MSRRSFRLDTPVPKPAHGAAARDAAQQALMLCGDGAADGPAAFTDRQLNEALNPLRLFPAVGVRCGRCEYGIAFIALNTQGATLVSGNKRQPRKKDRHGGVYDMGNLTEARGGSRALAGWQEDANADLGTVAPTGQREEMQTGYAQRRTHKCANCHAEYTHTNTTLLRMYLEVISRGDREIRLK